jgi:hypothetical protein
MQNPIFIKLSQFYANVHYNKLIEHKDMCKKTCEDQDNELTLEIWYDLRSSWKLI